MAVRKNHSFISNSKIRKFSTYFLIFSIPIILVLGTLELALRNINLEPKIKAQYLNQNKSEIEIAILGSSQSERAINPAYLDYPAINFSNSSQRIPENYKLLKAFADSLPELKLIIIELPYDVLFRNKEYTSKIVDQQNLIFYGINTFDRNIKIQDYLLYPSKPEYFWQRIKNYYLDRPVVRPNKYGFDTNHYYGTYQAKKHNDSLIKPKDIFIENVFDSIAFKENNLKLLDLLEFSIKNGWEILLYSPPNHYKYNSLKEQSLVTRRNDVVNKLREKFPQIKFFNEEENKTFTTELFYNANHLNPEGAKKATLNLNDYVNKYFQL